VPSSSLRVLHTIADLNLSGGGSRSAMASICEAQAAYGANVYIVSQAKTSTGKDENLFNPQDVEIHLERLALDSGRFRFKYTPLFGRRVKWLCRQKAIQIIHNHDLWLPSSHATAQVARRLGIPLVIHPHGTLAPWALEHRAWKKRLAWSVYQRRDLETASLFIATSDQEAESIRKVGLRQPIALIPLGIGLPAFEPPVDDDVKTRHALFLSRIHPVKGLLNLVTTWAEVRPIGWRIVVAGPDEENHRAVVEQAVRNAQLEQNFEFVGPVAGEAKEKLYRKADLFILPSFSENFGLVIGEALSYGIPVITTRGTPWEGLVKHRCGWWVAPTAESISDALRDAISLSDSERQAMGKRGRKFVEREFSWELVAEKMLNAYQWILGLGPKPSCIID
jgi:glycosyltransferase involved in cell wall biosynthesis